MGFDKWPTVLLETLFFVCRKLIYTGFLALESYNQYDSVRLNIFISMVPEWKCQAYKNTCHKVSESQSTNQKTFFAGGTSFIPNDYIRPRKLKILLSHFLYPVFAQSEKTVTNPEGYGGFHYDLVPDLVYRIFPKK